MTQFYFLVTQWQQSFISLASWEAQSPTPFFEPYYPPSSYHSHDSGEYYPPSPESSHDSEEYYPPPPYSFRDSEQSSPESPYNSHDSEEYYRPLPEPSYSSSDSEEYHSYPASPLFPPGNPYYLGESRLSTPEPSHDFEEYNPYPRSPRFRSTWVNPVYRFPSHPSLHTTPTVPRSSPSDPPSPRFRPGTPHHLYDLPLSTSTPFSPVARTHLSEERSWHGQTTNRPNSRGSHVPSQRSASWAHSNGCVCATPAFNRGSPAFNRESPAFNRELNNSLDLESRPRDWRADYTPREGILAFGARIFLSRQNESDVREFRDPIRRTLYPLLALDNSRVPPIYFDLRDDSFAPEDIKCLTFNRSFDDIDLAQLAIQPAGHSMRIFHPRLPWYIDIHGGSRPHGITVSDIFKQMHQQLHQGIQEKHYYNRVLNDADRKRLNVAFKLRVRGNPDLVRNGILQLDFLGDECVFEGLVKGARGNWELRTRKP